MEIKTAVALGLCVGLAWLFQTERSAQSALVQVQAQAQVLAQSESDKRTALALQPVALSLTMPQEMHALEQGALRLNFLAQRQTVREDVSAVQTAVEWRQFTQAGPSGQDQPRLKLKLQQWQQGRFTWEGLAGQTQDLEHLVLALSQLNRWSQPPGLVQLQSATPEAFSLTRKGLVFVLQGEVQMTPAKGS
jgi:hypothetical protein